MESVMTETRESRVRVQETESHKWISKTGEIYGDARLTLFFDFPETPPKFHFDLIELDPIYDDKGKCVFKGSQPGDTETVKEQWRIYGGPRIFIDLGKRGPLLDLPMSAPARGAISLQ